MNYETELRSVSCAPCFVSRSYVTKNNIQKDNILKYNYSKYFSSGSTQREGYAGMFAHPM